MSVGLGELAFHLNIMRLSNFQQVIALADCNLVLIALFINESNVEPTQELTSSFSIPCSTYSSPGFGGSKWPCETADVAEKARRGCSDPAEILGWHIF
jgi:hypothetical protein